MLIVGAKKTEEVCGQAFGEFWQKQNKQVPLPQDCEHPTGDTQSKNDFQIHLPREHHFFRIYLVIIVRSDLLLASLFNRCGNQFPEN